MQVLIVITALLWASLGWADADLSTQLTVLDARVSSDPTSIELRASRAELRLRAGLPIESLADLAWIAKQNPRDPRMLLIRATVHHSLGSPDLALADLDKRIRTGPPHPVAHDLRSEILQEQGQLVAALDDARAALTLAPSPERALRAVLLSEQLDGPLHAGTLSARTAQELDGAVVLHLEAIRRFREAQRPDLALQEIEMLLRSSPEHPDWLVLKADILDDGGHHDEALAIRSQALRRLNALLEVRPTPARRTARDRLADSLRENP